MRDLMQFHDFFFSKKESKFLGKSYMEGVTLRADLGVSFLVDFGVLFLEECWAKKRFLGGGGFIGGKDRLRALTSRFGAYE